MVLWISALEPAPQARYFFKKWGLLKRFAIRKSQRMPRRRREKNDIGEPQMHF